MEINPESRSLGYRERKAYESRVAPDLLLADSRHGAAGRFPPPTSSYPNGAAQSPGS